MIYIYIYKLTSKKTYSLYVPNKGHHVFENTFVIIILMANLDML